VAHEHKLDTCRFKRMNQIDDFATRMAENGADTSGV
jgi:hypothetical protein